VGADVRFGAHDGLKSDSAPLPKSAKIGGSAPQGLDPVTFSTYDLPILIADEL
jgi:hypothetical protein